MVCVIVLERGFRGVGRIWKILREDDGRRRVRRSKCWDWRMIFMQEELVMMMFRSWDRRELVRVVRGLDNAIKQRKSSFA